MAYTNNRLLKFLCIHFQSFISNQSIVSALLYMWPEHMCCNMWAIWSLSYFLYYVRWLKSVWRAATLDLHISGFQLQSLRCRILLGSYHTRSKIIFVWFPKSKNFSLITWLKLKAAVGIHGLWTPLSTNFHIIILGY